MDGNNLLLFFAPFSFSLFLSKYIVIAYDLFTPIFSMCSTLSCVILTLLLLRNQCWSDACALHLSKLPKGMLTTPHWAPAKGGLSENIMVNISKNLQLPIGSLPQSNTSIPIFIHRGRQEGMGVQPDYEFPHDQKPRKRKEFLETCHLGTRLGNAQFGFNPALQITDHPCLIPCPLRCPGHCSS